jgi:hypothetical protein
VDDVLHEVVGVGGVTHREIVTDPVISTAAATPARTAHVNHGCYEVAAVAPRVEFLGEGIHGSQFVVHLPMHWQSFRLFPALNSADVAL